MDLSLYQLLIAVFVVFVGALVQGMIGFGMAVVAAPILYIVAPSLVPGTLICMAMFLALLTVRKHRGTLKLAEMKYAVAGRVPGSLLGAYLLVVASREHMSLFMGGRCSSGGICQPVFRQDSSNKIQFVLRRCGVGCDRDNILYWRTTSRPGHAE